VGGHVFNSKNSSVHEWFWKKFDRNNEFTKANRKAAILIDNTFVDYPIELHLSQLKEELARQSFEELLVRTDKNKCHNSYKNFGEFLVGNFGETLCGLYFEPYNKKIWKSSLESIPLEWLDGKLPMIRPKEIL
jgi:UDP-galactopyranose mutase